jgi:hypothetical protein
MKHHQREKVKLIVHVNEKLQLNNIENEKVIIINDDNKNTYKKIYIINFNEENIFIVLCDFHIEL